MRGKVKIEGEESRKGKETKTQQNAPALSE
jgi:hypothetical protein